MRQHKLSTARDQIAQNYDPPVEDAAGSTIYSKTTFASCAWPRPTYADPDGYSEVVAVLTDGPGDSEASDASSLDRLKTSGCATVEVLYTYGSQGFSERQPPYILKLGDVISAYTGEPWTGESPCPYPARDEIVVVHNSKIGLDSAHCVEPVGAAQ